MKLELLYFNYCISMLRLGFQELQIVTQALSLLRAAMRMLRLHLVLERLIFSIFICHNVLKKHTRKTKKKHQKTTPGTPQFYDFEYRNKV